MRLLRRGSSVVALAAFAMLLSPANTAVAQTDGNSGDAYPDLELSTDSIDFGDGAGSAEITIKNVGDAPLHVQTVRVIEEGYIKRFEAAEKAHKASGTEDPFTPPTKVFTLVGAPENIDIEPGSSVPFTVTYARIKNGKQRQFFGALQIVADDDQLPSYSSEAKDGTVTHTYIAAVKLQAGG